MGRPSWDDIWMALASSLAMRSRCRRGSVGCIIVTKDNCRVLSVGYNGGAKGLDNDCLSMEPGKCGHLHAEINALVKMNYAEAAQKKAYVTTTPCYTCATALINAGVSEVIYWEEYRLSDGLDLLRKAGVEVRHWEDPSLLS